MKNRKKIICLLLSCSLLIAMVTVSPFNASAQAGETEKSSAITVNQAMIAHFEKLLLNCDEADRIQLLKKAVIAGITSNDLSSISLSASDVAIMEKMHNTTKASIHNKRIFSAPSSVSAVSNATVFSTNDMPDYALWPNIYMQETASWCRAGVIQTILMYINGTSPSQSTIIANCAASLDAMDDYVNDYLPDNYGNYIYQLYGGDQQEFNSCLAYDVLHYQPMMFAMKNATSSTVNWPYYTNGHYSICCGLITWENNQYFIGDPYYFSRYVRSATSNDGYHKKTWTQLNTAITNSHGQNNQHIVW